MQAEGGNRRAGMATAGYPVGHHDMALHAATNAAMATPMGDGMSAVMNQFNAMNLSAGSAAGGVPNMQANGYINGAENIVFAHPYNGGGMHPMVPADHYGAAAYPIQYGMGNFAGPYAGAMMPFTPNQARPAVTYGERAPRDLPGLENRRSSYSTSATESTPATPFFGHGTDRLNGTRVAPLDRSAYTTPSPREAMSHFNPNGPQAKAPVDPDLERLLMQDPPIPKAVPAVWTDHVKPLEQCLESRISGNRNVYIRGLHPTTDDELLLKYAERFGEVEQSKAIIDTATGACKGFGFAKFVDGGNSDACIRGFYRLGYEVGFARESFNARLKAEGDELSTNLYISNLPKDVNESMLIQIFDPYTIVSSKILRDSMGNSRGVGFARFETRDVCEKVIINFHGQAIGKDNHLMQVRYADTPSQKELKRITAERRQYRANEYNIGAYGTHAVGMTPAMYNPNMWNRRPAGGATYSSGTTRSAGTGGPSGQGSSSRATQETSNTSGTASSEDGSADEGVTIVDSPAVPTSTQSSPSAKKEAA